jgi:hypothetical protein
MCVHYGHQFLNYPQTNFHLNNMIRIMQRIVSYTSDRDFTWGHYSNAIFELEMDSTKHIK